MLARVAVRGVGTPRTCDVFAFTRGFQVPAWHENCIYKSGLRTEEPPCTLDALLRESL